MHESTKPAKRHRYDNDKRPQRKAELHFSTWVSLKHTRTLKDEKNHSCTYLIGLKQCSSPSLYSQESGYKIKLRLREGVKKLYFLEHKFTKSRGGISFITGGSFSTSMLDVENKPRKTSVPSYVE